MSGGAYEYVMGYNVDATGEMGPFANVIDPDNDSRHRLSWYGDYGYTVFPRYPWFRRGSNWHDGVLTGIFGFSSYVGGVSSAFSFRIVLTP